MHDNKEKMISELTTLMAREGWVQREVSQQLGISQGHFSKILTQKSPISRKLKPKITRLLAVKRLGKETRADLEGDIISAVQTSASFRNLIRAALEMHKNALNTEKQRAEDT